MNKIAFVIAMLGIGFEPCAQSNYPTNPVKPTPSEQRVSTNVNQELLMNYPIKNIGPTIMGGRVSDLEVDPANPNHFFVAFASGGLWETNNNGATFKPIADTLPTLTIGDFDVHWPTGTLYIGTGEVNSSRSSYAGTGVYKSTNAGKTWSFAGLPESHHIGRINIHPSNPDKVTVAVLGSLYSPSKNRGIYITSDGGKTWQHTLFVHENAGCVDLVTDPENADILYTSAWERTRRAWNFWEAGPSSGIYKSTDGGKTWALMTNANNGFPAAPYCGRIGLSIFHKGEKFSLYALVDHQKPDTTTPKKEGYQKKDFQKMEKSTFLGLNDSMLNLFLKSNNVPGYYSTAKMKELVRRDSLKPADIYIYLTNANDDLFESGVIGPELYVSHDGGLHWTRTHQTSLNKVSYTYGYYFGMVKVSPVNADEVYIAGVPMLRSEDGGKTFEFAGGDNVHVDHHALWINPANPNHIINGNDGGVVISYDKGKNWYRCQHPPVGQCYSVYADAGKHYQVYSGFQDNGVWKGPGHYNYSTDWQMEGKYPYQSIMGGDGMQVAKDDKENQVYTGYQFGNYFRIDEITGTRTFIQPKHKMGESPLRFNWQSPIWLSQHNQDILYFGSNKVHRSLNKGNQWTDISGDLTKGSIKGDVSFGTITSIHESPHQFGQLIVGTDDGLVHLTLDGGITWNKIDAGLPASFWVSRVRFSQHDAKTLYVCLNGYRWDHFESMVYKSVDLGKNWVKLSGLPTSPVNVIQEDIKDKNLIYVGTDNGLYTSIDGVSSFIRGPGALPDVAVHDLFQHKDGDLLIGTHGRSIYQMTTHPLNKLSQVKDSALVLFQPTDLIFNKSWGSQQFDFTYYEPSLDWVLFNGSCGDSLTLQIYSPTGQLIYESKKRMDIGFNVWKYTLQMEENRIPSNLKQTLTKQDNGKYYLPVGEYRMELRCRDTISVKSLKVKTPDR